MPFNPGASYSYSGMIPQTPNIKAGQTLTATIDRFPVGPSLAPGTTSGTVSLRYADGTLIQAEEDTVSVPVGTFKIRVP